MLIPTCIKDRTSERMILYHSFDVQVFEGEEVVRPSELSREFMIEVRAKRTNLPV